MERIRYIYKITNLVNGHTYFGQRTLTEGRSFETDTYRGSGKLLWQAYEKYGKENFKRECVIIGEFSKRQINRFEKCIIASQKLIGKAEYNLASGGDGGDLSRFIDYHSDSYKKHMSDAMKKAYKEGRNKGWYYCNKNHHSNKGTTGFKFSEESKKKMSESHKGSANSQFGTHWWTNGVKNVKSATCPDGFYKGRSKV